METLLQAILCPIVLFGLVALIGFVPLRLLEKAKETPTKESRKNSKQLNQIVGKRNFNSNKSDKADIEKLIKQFK